MANQIAEHMPQLKYHCEKLEKDPFVFLNYFQPLRLHPRTRELVEVAISDSKPEIADKYLFGLILAERSVIHIIKNDDKLSVGATGKNSCFTNNRY